MFDLKLANAIFPQEVFGTLQDLKLLQFALSYMKRNKFAVYESEVKGSKIYSLS